MCISSGDCRAAIDRRICSSRPRIIIHRRRLVLRPATQHGFLPWLKIPPQENLLGGKSRKSVLANHLGCLFFRPKNKRCGEKELSEFWGPGKKKGGKPPPGLLNTQNQLPLKIALLFKELTPFVN